MKILKWLLIVIVALAVLIIGGGYLISPKFTVTRSTVVNATPDKIYPLVAAPKAWKQWSVWNQRDPAMQITYTGPESGAGAAWEWKSASEGDGKMTMTSAEPNKRVAFELYFPDFDSTSSSELTFTPADNDSKATRVAWTMNGDMGGNPIARWFSLFMDGTVGKDFEAGLTNLKALAEKA